MLEWKDKQDGIDDVLAEDINVLAKNLIETQKELGKKVVDLTYSPESSNAQSGIAVAEVVSTKANLQLKELDITEYTVMADLLIGTYIYELKTLYVNSVGDYELTFTNGSTIITSPNEAFKEGNKYLITAHLDNDAGWVFDVVAEVIDLEDKVNIADIDQTYNPESENAQSGIAIAEAVSGKADKEEWELINELTLTEEAVVSFTDISLKKFKVLAQLTNVTSSTYLWLRLNSRLAIQTDTSSAKTSSYGIEAEHNFDWQFLTCASTNAYVNNSIKSTPYGHRYSGENIPYPCTKIELALDSAISAALPTGTTIRLWGVRA